MTLTDEQYQQFLDLHEEHYDGLTWDPSNGHYIVTGTNAYADEHAEHGDTYRVWKDDRDQIVVNGDIIVEDLSHYLEEAGIDGDLWHECQERLNLANR